MTVVCLEGRSVVHQDILYLLLSSAVLSLLYAQSQQAGSPYWLHCYGITNSYQLKYIAEQSNLNTLLRKNNTSSVTALIRLSLCTYVLQE